MGISTAQVKTSGKMPGGESGFSDEFKRDAVAQITERAYRVAEVSRRPSGFYAWKKSPLRQRAREDARQTGLIRQVWNESGKVYGYRKLHDDLLDKGETVVRTVLRD